MILKRCFDFITALFGIIILAPAGIGIALLIWMESGFPVFFRQTRVGLNRANFTMLKFRTMTVKKGTESGSFDAGVSARVTRIGKILRKTKFDEFPQLWNVLVGDMSIVGPRPEVQKWVEAYPERWKQVLTVKPGITDNAAIEFRNEEEILSRAADPQNTYRNEILPRKLALYEQYAVNNSFTGDILIIFRTIWTILGR